MRSRLGSVRYLALGLASLLLASCSQLHLTQERDELLVRVGEAREVRKAASHADLFLDYALLSEQSYADSLYDKAKPRPYDIGENTYCKARVRPEDPCVDREGLTPYAIERVRRWRLIYAENDPKRFRCLPHRANCTEPVPGIGVQVWMKRGRVCPEAAIVFRGTDGQSADDWLSNLRWVLRLLPLYDQYEQVQDYTPAFVARIEAEPCFVRGRTRIVAIGHSLGGGLAQQSAFQDRRVRRVLAFDPSFVTGASDVEPGLLARNVQGLQIDRIYEHGEILAYPRFVLRQLSPLPACNPFIRTVRLNTLEGNAVEQHSLHGITVALLDWSKARRPKGLPANEPLPGPRPEACSPQVATL